MLRALLIFATTASLTACSQAQSPAVNLPSPVANTKIWRPPPGIRWQWQLTTPVDRRIEADLFIIDLFDNDKRVVSALNAQGRRVFCYLSAGAWEDWRPDAKQFPPAVLGRAYEGWPGERWLDIRQIDLLAPLMRARLDLCRAKGFDGVELDNVDGYINQTGFPLTGDDQLRFNAWLANEARSRGLSVGLKNNPEQATALLPYFDWALEESCFSEGWCGDLKAFVAAGKAVLVAEYTHTRGLRFEEACRNAAALGMSLILKRRALDAWRRECP